MSEASDHCCSVQRQGGHVDGSRPLLDHVQRDRGTEAMVLIDAGDFLMGNEDSSANPGDGEGPVRTVDLPEFWIDEVAVTASDYAAFTEETGYRTEAERIGWSMVFAAAVHPRAVSSILSGSVPGLPWWLAVTDASWRAPDGPGSDWHERPDHPAVHISWNDAVAFAAWCGKRLPTEAEWEKAARGGLQAATYPWGNELTPQGQHMCNIWQGDFPLNNLAVDGYLTTAPSRSFPANGFGLYNMSGNIWEWCADGWSRDAIDKNAPARVIRGGSYLCHQSYCNRYRVSARSYNTADSATGHMGFRCVKDAQ